MKTSAFSRAIHWVLAAAISTLTLPQDANATTMIKLSTPQMVAASDAIVRGKIVEVWTEQDSDGVVWTRAQVAVEQTYKGDASQTGYIIDQVGGEWGNARTIVHGGARFSADENVLLFLETLGSGKTVPVGMKQGKYTLRLDPYSRELIAQRFTPGPTQSYDHRFIPLPKESSRLFLVDLEETITHRVSAGWDGIAIPGTSLERLQRINPTIDTMEVK